MNYVTTNENIKMPSVIYGTAWKEDETARLVELALKKGFRGVDTACQPKHYQENLVGQGIKNAIANGIKREDIFIQTKFTPIDGQDPNRVPYNPKNNIAEQVLESFEVSKKNLGVDYIDSLVLHSPVFPAEKLHQVWEAFEKIYHRGEVAQLGISNCYDLNYLQYMEETFDIQPAVIQNRFYAHSNYDTNIRRWAKERGIIYQSFWSLTANINTLNSETVIHLVQKYQKTQAQIFYRFLHQHNIVPLIGTTSEQHMEDDLEIFDFSLDPQESYAVLDLLFNPQ
jgi:diketogulonate reductase-like aldo/keto reductase